MRFAAPIQLAPEERQTLHNVLAAPQSPPRMRLRALIILELAAGLSNLETARKLGCSRRTTGIWRQRFLQHRLQSLVARHSKAGRKPTIRNACCECVVRHLTENQAAGQTLWSIRAIARACGVSKDTVHRIARQYNFNISRRSGTSSSHTAKQQASDEIARGPADKAQDPIILSSQPPAAATDCRPDQVLPGHPGPEQHQVPEPQSSAPPQIHE